MQRLDLVGTVTGSRFAAAAINLAVFLLNLFFLEESPDYLVTRQPKGALARARPFLRGVHA